MFATLALFAVGLEALFGYPRPLMSWVGHPVQWLGSLIAWCDRQWNIGASSGSQKQRAGAKTTAVCLLIALAITSAIIWSLAQILPQFLQFMVIAILASTLLAQKSLYEHVANVADFIQSEDIAGARDAVGQIVGRDTSVLDQPAICRAAIESLAENFSDGVVAPTFWLSIAGLPGAVTYKTINTADSMIGYRTQRYKDFGWAAARLDDVVNWPAARLSALLMTIAAVVSPGARAATAIKCISRDARKHRSPNAGWPESAMAGAIGLKLAGPRTYDGQLINEPWIGDGREAATHEDIQNALALYVRACWVQAVLLATVAIAVFLI